jgi:hypothetical protein
LQIVGSACKVCANPIAFANDAARCAACGNAFHERCRSSERCPVCDAAGAGASPRIFAQRCPACDLSTGQSLALVCQVCGARTGWDDADELQRHQAACRSQALGDLGRGALQFVVPLLLAWIAIRVGLAYLLVFGYLSLILTVLLLGVSVMLLAWSLRSFHSAWRLWRPVRLRPHSSI